VGLIGCGAAVPGAAKPALRADKNVKRTHWATRSKTRSKTAQITSAEHQDKSPKSSRTTAFRLTPFKR